MRPEIRRGAKGDVDAPPYAWLDDTSRTGGAVGVRTTIGSGVLLGAVGLFGVVMGVVGGDEGRPARLVVGAGVTLVGAVVFRMGIVRRAWRLRHPGVDPSEAARRAGVALGQPFGDGSTRARVGRWLLALVCGATVVVGALALVRIADGSSPGGTGSVVLIVLLAGFAAAVGWAGRPGRRPDGPTG